MRPVSLGAPHELHGFEQWVQWALSEIERASYEGIDTAADAYTVTNFTETRELDASTATTQDIANVLCTFLSDLKKRGAKRRS